jgi:tRNA A37 threonylcarbamoyladenosine dehydratase
MNAALWIANHWLADPIVMGARDIYLKTVEAQSLLLDKDEFAAMLLKTATEKNLDKTRYAIEAKERVNILKLYAEVRGFLNKNETNINNFNNNEGLKVVFVKSEPLQPKTINQVPNEKSEILNEVPLPLNIKLVSNG